MSRRVVFLLLAVLSAPVAAQVGISPQYQEIQLDGGSASHTFRLFNFTDEEKTFQVSVSHWDFDEDNAVVEKPAAPGTLARSLIVNPARFTLPPGEYQVVRFALHPAARFEQGEHRAMLYFDEELSEEQIERAEGLRLRVRVGAAVYGQVGERRRAGVLESAEVDGDTVVLTLRNTGNANVRLLGDWAVWEAARFPGAEATDRETDAGDLHPPGRLARSPLPTTPVLPGRTQKLRFRLPGEVLIPGREYVLDLNALLGDAEQAVSIPFRRSP